MGRCDGGAAFAGNVIDVFAGCGGMSLGFSWAGFRVVAAVEMDEWAADTYAHNHPGTRLHRGDVRELKDWDSLVPPALDGRIVGVIGGPPCQGLSLCGRRDPKDPRNALFMEFMRCVRRFRPAFLVMENVPGLLSMRTAAGEPVLDAILAECSAVGYEAAPSVLCAADHGVPQLRRRLIIVGVDRRLAIDPASMIPPPSVRPEDRVSVDMAIADLPPIGAGEGTERQAYASLPMNAYQAWARLGSDAVLNHVAMRHTARIVGRFKLIRPGQCVKDVPAEHAARKRGDPGSISGRTYGQNNMRMRGDAPAPTIPASFQSNFIHPHLDRNLTAREGARLQSFPDSYIFKGARTTMSWEQRLSQYEQVGNAVPPLLAKAVGLAVLKALGADFPVARDPDRRSPPVTQSGDPSLPSVTVSLRKQPKEDGMSATDGVRGFVGRERRERRKLRTLGLFAGCGGLDLGFKQSGGFRIVAANEFWKPAADTYRLNHRTTALVDGDITADETKQAICNHFDKEPCEAVIGGFPCQFASVAGKRDANDPRGRLYEHYITLVRRLHPHIVVMENVPGILTMVRPDGIPVMDWITKALRQLGYAVGYRRLNAADFGVPQARERIFILSWRSGGIPRTARTHDEHGRDGMPGWRTFRDAVDGLTDAPGCVQFPAKMMRFIRLLKAGQNWNHLPEHLKAEAMGGLMDRDGGSTGCFRRLSWDRPSPTLTCSPIQKMTSLCHPDEDRPLSVQEYRRIQQFPDDYEMSGSVADQYAQLGNAVPVGLARAVAAAVALAVRMALPEDPGVRVDRSLQGREEAKAAHAGTPGIDHRKSHVTPIRAQSHHPVTVEG